VATVHCHKDIVNFVLFGIQGDCKVTKENSLEQGQTQNEDKDAKLFLFLVICGLK
jgi:hypothetical protein